MLLAREYAYIQRVYFICCGIAISRDDDDDVVVVVLMSRWSSSKTPGRTSGTWWSGVQVIKHAKDKRGRVFVINASHSKRLPHL